MRETGDQGRRAIPPHGLSQRFPAQELYDATDTPVATCSTPEYAREIVAAHNSLTRQIAEDVVEVGSENDRLRAEVVRLRGALEGICTMGHSDLIHRAPMIARAALEPKP